MTHGSLIEPAIQTHTLETDGTSHVVLSLVTSRVFQLRGFTHLNWPLRNLTRKLPIHKNKIKNPLHETSLDEN